MATSFSSFRQSEPPLVLCLSADPSFANNVRRALAEAGFSAVYARSPAEAIELVTESNFDALLCDYDLLQSDALTLYEHIKDATISAAPPLLVALDRPSEAIESQAAQAGADGVWIKSDNMEDLVSRVAEMIRDDGKRFLVESSASKRRLRGGTDPLTRIASREHFNRRFNGESAAAYRDQSPLALLIVVVDNYEKLAATSGKPRAEGSLAQVARLIEGELRSRDCVARYADYTFAVILPDTPLEAAAAVGRRLRRRLSSSEFGDIDDSVTLTVSIGVTSRPPGTQISPIDLANQALRAAAGAQMMGGDRVMADNVLSGSPLVVVLGDPNGETGAVATGLESCNVEVRQAYSIREAKEILESIPCAMLVADQDLPGQSSAVELLTWCRNQYPAIRRVLISSQVDQKIMSQAVNMAAIHYFVPVPVNIGQLSKIVDQLLFV
jgi:diguanylate cyclase (GGDEF)-like protein